MIGIRIWVSGGQAYETSCAEDDPLVGAIAALLSPNGLPPPPFLSIEVETDGKRKGVAIPVGAVAAIETEPPFVFPEPVEPALYLRIPEFLAPEENRQLLDYAISREADFVGSKVDSTYLSESEKLKYRRSFVLPQFDDLGVDLEPRLREIAPEVLAHFKITAPPEMAFEKQLTTHSDGCYFSMHNDNGSPSTASRVLTFVYYFHHEPRAFSGGQIRIYDSRVENGYWRAAQTFVDIEPENNTLLFFPSRMMHEVLAIACPSEVFADGRFTVNGAFRDPRIAVMAN